MKICCMRRRSVAAFCLAALLVLCVASVVGASEGEAHGAKGWVATDTYRVMNFGVLAVVLFFVLRKPAGKALNDRIKGIQHQLEDLENRKSDAEKQLADYAEKLATLEQEANQIVDQYIKQGQDAKARIIEEAKETADKLEEQARKNIEREFERAKAKLQSDILEKSLAKAEEIIREQITPEDQNQLVDEYLDKVVA